MAAALVVVMVVVVMLPIIVVVALTVAIVVQCFSFAWHIFHGYDLLVVQGRWLKHPSGAVTNNSNNNNSSRTSGQVSTPPPPSPCFSHSLDSTVCLFWADLGQLVET